MALSTEQTKVLIELVASNFSIVADEKVRFCSLLDSEYCHASIDKEATRQLVHDGCNKKMIAFLTFNELASVLPVDEELIDGMETDSFNFIIGCIDQQIQMMNGRHTYIDNFKTITTPEVFELIKLDFDKKLTQWEDIKRNMNSMFSYS